MLTKLLFKGENTVFTDVDIALVEHLIGYRVPEEVIRVWARLSGCLFGWQNSEAVSISRDLRDSFFSECFGCFRVIEVFGENSIRSTLENLDFGVPGHYLPFVSDLAGNLVVLKLGEPHASVFFWDHESNELFFAFASLRDFFYSLRPFSEMPRDEEDEELRECFSIDIDQLLREQP